MEKLKTNKNKYNTKVKENIKYIFEELYRIRWNFLILVSILYCLINYEKLGLTLPNQDYHDSKSRAKIGLVIIQIFKDKSE
jgi:hypothetical protein